MSNEAMLDWEKLKQCLSTLHHDSKLFLGRALLIGGAACWFYRIRLRQANDADFRANPLPPDQEAFWLSKDIDFTGIFYEDAMALIPGRVAVDAHGRRYISVEGIRLGFAQVGLTIDPEEALRDAMIGSFQFHGRIVEFRVADAVTLYREKQALVQRRNQTNDRLHFEVMRDYLAWRATTLAEGFVAAQGALGMEAQQQMYKFLSAIRRKAPEILVETRLRRRLEPVFRQGTPASRLVAQMLDPT